ncbi:MAG: signal recognition particle protein [Thermodesulfovibrionales bacterium]|nr:signal recognition particle protein [Thermodesulfovibrionales bacterium]MDP3111724.1 signal recognition particle protein [Thermodesulfovibrionales bacterium]
MFESLTEKLESIFKKLRGRGLLKEEDVEAALKEVRLALLEADVNFKVVKDFIQKVKDKAIGKEVLESLTPGQQVIKIVNNELCALLGGASSRIQLSPNPPTVIMMVGLHGSGKTTTSAKLARFFRKEGRRPMLVAADLQRPAAIEQLITLGSQIDVPVFYSKDAKDPVALCVESIKKARLDARDILILDTAGRLHIDEGLMTELKNVKDAVSPKEVIFVADSMTGQDAVNIAKNFNEQIGIDGIILTKMDGDARGGAAISIRAITEKPIKFIGTGEKIDMLEPFHPERVASRILGMGDMLSLIEQTQNAFEQKEAEKLQEKILGESFTFDDLKEQLKKIRNMGPLENILNMIPGMSNKMKGVSLDGKELVRTEAVINSMTLAERRNHNLLNGSRRKRIAMGSGTTAADVNRVVKQYVELKKMLKMFKGKKGIKLPKGLPF